jgi:hypothetical protein
MKTNIINGSEVSRLSVAIQFYLQRKTHSVIAPRFCMFSYMEALKRGMDSTSKVQMGYIYLQYPRYFVLRKG